MPAVFETLATSVKQESVKLLLIEDIDINAAFQSWPSSKKWKRTRRSMDDCWRQFSDSSHRVGHAVISSIFLARHRRAGRVVNSCTAAKIRRRLLTQHTTPWQAHSLMVVGARGLGRPFLVLIRPGAMSDLSPDARQSGRSNDRLSLWDDVPGRRSEQVIPTSLLD